MSEVALCGDGGVGMPRAGMLGPVPEVGMKQWSASVLIPRRSAQVAPKQSAVSNDAFSSSR